MCLYEQKKKRKRFFKLRPVHVTTMRSKLFQTWSEEGKIEDETHQDEPGVRRWTVVVGPDRAVSRFRLVKTPEIKTKVSRYTVAELVNFYSSSSPYELNRCDQLNPGCTLTHKVADTVT